jgi:hypothetical protein
LLTPTAPATNRTPVQTGRLLSADEIIENARVIAAGSGSHFALNGFMSGAREMGEHGTFTFVGENPPGRELLEGFAKGRG